MIRCVHRYKVTIYPYPSEKFPEHSMTQPNSANANYDRSSREGLCVKSDNTEEGSTIPSPSAVQKLSTNSPSTPKYSPLLIANNLPAFLNKLYGMVNSAETDSWVHWTEGGESFIIPNSQALAEHVLGLHFKHNNFASFVRQLNMYGFHKVPHLSHGILYNDGAPEVWEFANENFHRDEPEKIRLIVRKKGEAEKARSAAKQRQSSPLAMGAQDIADLAIARAEIQTVANRQNVIREDVIRLANSTENLWKYALETRHRCQEQQEKVNRLLKFLSEAFRKRNLNTNNTDLPSKVRGLIEGSSAPFEELREGATAVQTPMSSGSSSSSEAGQLDVMKMIASGKIPMGFLQDAIQQYFQNISSLPTSTIHSPAPLDPADESLAMYQAAASNAQQLAQVQEWVNYTDQNINALYIGLDGGNAANYGGYLNDPNLNFDSLAPESECNPASMGMFSADHSLDASLHPWISYFNPETEDTTNIAGQKRTLEGEQDNTSLGKRARI
jgi:hypothetical protein